MLTRTRVTLLSFLAFALFAIGMMSMTNTAHAVPDRAVDFSIFLMLCAKEVPLGATGYEAQPSGYSERLYWRKAGIIGKSRQHPNGGIYVVQNDHYLWKINDCKDIQLRSVELVATGNFR